MGTYVHKADNLAKIVRVLRGQGKKVTLTTGAFDVLHVGHVRGIRDAAHRCDYFIVALESDASVRRRKGTGRPLQSVADRAEMLCGIKGVDYVTLYDGETADEILRLLRPDTYAKGPAFRRTTLPERKTLQETGIEFLRVGSGGPRTEELLNGLRTADEPAPRKKAATIAAKKAVSRPAKGAAKPAAEAGTKPRSRPASPAATKAASRGAKKVPTTRRAAPRKAATRSRTAEAAAAPARRSKSQSR